MRINSISSLLAQLKFSDGTRLIFGATPETLNQIH